MELVLVTALGVGGATVIGALLGFLFKSPSHKWSDIILSFAAGVMLCAAIIGLILPSLEGGQLSALLLAIPAMFLGALFLLGVDKLVPHLHVPLGNELETHPDSVKRVNRVLLFVLAIAIHNLPEGIAAGVSFGTGDTSAALAVAGGIALQNIPEGMVIIAPMLAAGISRKKTFFLATMTGLVEVIGTFIGYFAVNISTALLPFALAFAGGTMLYVISDEMIPETHSHGNERSATFSLLFGFAFMLAFDFLMTKWA